MVEIAPSLLSADFICLEKEIKRVKDAGISMLHIDVMDGHFVPNITVGPMVVKSIKSKFSIFLDVHLMISKPDEYIEDFKDAGADLITVHSETCLHLDRTLEKIKNYGIKAGVSLNPATPPDIINWVSEKLDLVLVMSVNPGFGNQDFLPNSIEKISQIKRMREQLGGKWKIQVDGGINTNTAPKVIKAGADILVSGSAIFEGDKDPAEIIKLLKSANTI